MVSPPVYVHSPGANVAGAAAYVSAAGKALAPPPPLRPKDYVIDVGSAGFGEAESRLGSPHTPPPPGSEVDWAKVYFGQYDLPGDLIGQIEKLGKQYGATNPDVFYNSALNAVRGSTWFTATYPGFAAGVRAGLFQDESGYRGYVSSLNSIYQQYTGRAVSGDETAAALGQGATPGLIGRQFQGDAIAKTNAPEWQYVSGAFDSTGALTAEERTAYGREQAGIDTPLGQMVQKRVQQAMGRATAIFGGTLATPSMSLAKGRLSAPSLSTSSTPDIAA